MSLKGLYGYNFSVPILSQKNNVDIQSLIEQLCKFVIWICLGGQRTCIICELIDTSFCQKKKCASVITYQIGLLLPIFFNPLGVVTVDGSGTQRARKFKKVQAKKLVKSNKSKKIFHEVIFLAVLNCFPVQKLIFGHF